MGFFHRASKRCIWYMRPYWLSGATTRHWLSQARLYRIRPVSGAAWFRACSKKHRSEPTENRYIEKQLRESSGHLILRPGAPSHNKP